MTKSEILKISINDAYTLGYNHRKINKSIHYNPYRNIDISKDAYISELNTRYIDGWTMADKEIKKD
jgi:hypothetical protein